MWFDFRVSFQFEGLSLDILNILLLFFLIADINFHLEMTIKINKMKYSRNRSKRENFKISQQNPETAVDFFLLEE